MTTNQEEELDDAAFEAFAMLHPHEAHAKWPDRFWEIFQTQFPGVPKEEMEKMLRETDPEGNPQ